jgi:hypothetical protein
MYFIGCSSSVRSRPWWRAFRCGSEPTRRIRQPGGKNFSAGRVPGAGRRTRDYDESFLNAFALRIGERLRAATDAADREATAQAGPERLLPVLATRAEAVRERLDTLFPGVVRGRLTVRDAEGWSSGTSAADRASLGAGPAPKRQVRGRR